MHECRCRDTNQALKKCGGVRSSATPLKFGVVAPPHIKHESVHTLVHCGMKSPTVLSTSGIFAKDQPRDALQKQTNGSFTKLAPIHGSFVPVNGQADDQSVKGLHLRYVSSLQLHLLVPQLQEGASQQDGLACRLIDHWNRRLARGAPEQDSSGSSAVMAKASGSTLNAR